MRPFDSSGEFRPVASDGAMRQIAVRGAGATVFASALSVGVQMVATVVLARLLTPQDFGVVAMVTTFSLLLVNFGLNGFTEAVIQRDRINRLLASNLFWINLGVGVLLTLGFAAAGSLLADFYHDDRVAHVAVGISLTIFFTSASVLHLALLKRAMRFFAASVNDIVAGAVSVVVSIILGWLGWGYWALVVGTVARPLSQTIGAWFLCSWLPSLPRRVEGTGAMVRFALNIYGRFTVNYFSRNTDNLLVGWRFGSGPLGFYKKAYDLFLLSACQLVSPLTSVATSALSRYQQDSKQYRRYLLGALGVTSFIGMALGADLTLVGRDVIRLVLGPGWETAGRIFTFFGPGVGIMLLYSTHGWIHLSIGTADRWFRWVFVEFGVTLFLFLITLHWGPEGIAAAWTASFWILTIPAFWYAGRPIHFGVGPVLGAVWKYIAASLLGGVTSAWILRGMPTLAGIPGAEGALVRIVVTSLLFSIIYLVFVILLHRGFGPIYQVGRLLREMLPNKFSRRPAAAAAKDAYARDMLSAATEESTVTSHQ